MHIGSHKTPSAKLHELEQVADVGESDETPPILIGEVSFVVAIALVVLLALALVAYRLAT